MRAPRRAHRRLAGALVGLAAALVLVGCTSEPTATQERAQVDVTAPELGACRVLGPEDVALASNATETVDCAEQHTAETYAVGDLPPELADAAYDDPAIGAWAFTECSGSFKEFLGADESLAMRTVVSWAFFRPSETAWDQGARWYRCDVVGGGEQSKDYLELPPTARGLLAVRPEKRDQWMVCVAGRSVNTAPKIPCSREHDWRAVGTIKVGEPGATYPGDRVVEVTTRDFCSDYVGAWLGYPDTYDYGFTWFRQVEWDAGNRRSICWAKTAL